MRKLTILALLLALFLCRDIPVNGQGGLIDEYFKKEGITVQPGLSARPNYTLFAKYSPKGNKDGVDNVVLSECSRKIQSYLSPSFLKKKENSHFTILRYLELKDSVSYFNSLNDYPQSLRTFYKGVYLVEANNYDAALPVFDSLKQSYSNKVIPIVADSSTIIGSDSVLILLADSLKAAAFTDSVLNKETMFWLEACKKLLADQVEYNKVLDLYAELEHPKKDRFAFVSNKLNEIRAPEYIFHKYLIWFNYCYNIKDYLTCRSIYDSVIAYTTHGKLKSSLMKNRAVVFEILTATNDYIDITSRKLYYYDMSELYEHLVDWTTAYSTGKEYLEDAKFVLNTLNTKPLDTVYTRYLVDTSEVDSLTKFEVMSFTRTPWDKAGKRFVIVKLGFSNHDTYKYYHEALTSFKSKPISQSILSKNTGFIGDEYLITKNYIAALYEQKEPVVKYVMSLYALEDKEGNMFDFDTLF